MFKWIKSYLEKKRIERQQELDAKKKRINNTLLKEWSKEEVESANITLIANSGGWIGGNWSEKDLKLRILQGNKELFSESEIDDLIEKIKQN
jgi:hypothetical protein